MTALEPFDSAYFTRAPVLTIGGAITLGRKLAEDCPKAMPANCKKAAKKLATVVDAAQAAWADRQRELGVIGEEDSRLVDQLTDNLWSALRSRLQAYSVLPALDFPKSARAGELCVVLFGDDGLSFLKEPYPVQFSTMDTLIRRIDADKLQKEIDDLAGPEFLQAIRKVMPRYDAIVTAMLKRDDASGQNLLDHVRAVQRAIVNYATAVCGTVDDDEPETVKLARKLLQPIVNARGQGSSGRRSEEASDDAGEDQGAAPPKVASQPK